MSKGTGAISKLTIRAYADEEFTSQKGEFETLINPPEYTIISDVDYHVAQSMGVAGGTLKYNTSAPRRLVFSLHFDETFLPSSEKKKTVAQQIKELNDVVYKYQEEGHSPYYIRIIWGSLDFKGKLSKLSINPTMFENQGSPIRAKVDLVVLEDVEALNKAKKRAAEEAARRKKAKRAVGAESEATAGATNGSTAGAAANGSAAGAASSTAAGAASGAGSAAGSSGNAAGADAAGGAGSGAAGQEAKEAGQAGDEAAQGGDGTQGDNPAEEGASTAEHENGPPDGDPNSTEGGADAADSAKAATDGQSIETKEGDKLSQIADDTYGDPSSFKDLAKVNDLDNLMKLPAGLALALPSFNLLAMLLALLKKGLSWLKKKGSKAVDKGKSMANKAKKKL